MARVSEASETKTYDVTDTCCQFFWIVTCPLTCAAICPGILGQKTLVLEDEEAVLTQDCCIYNSVVHRPYGELGSVETVQACCCVGFSSNLSESSGEGGGKAPMIPGNCCETALVNEIVNELKMRMKTRGDTGNILRAEENLREIRSVQGLPEFTSLDQAVGVDEIHIPTAGAFGE
ncbi:unnamed protein product [Scytosiphon promiscuus]